MDPTTLEHCSDEDLLLRLKGGEAEGFETLVRRYERELYGYLRRYLGDPHLADDVFQNTFLQLFLKADQYQAGRPVRPWLFTIATNQAIDATRRVKRQAMASLDQQLSAEAADSDLRSLLETLQAGGGGPAERALDAERVVVVRDWIERLPDFLKQVVHLAYYQGMKYREIADELQIPVGTVKSRLHTAMQRLQESPGAAHSLPEA